MDGNVSVSDTITLNVGGMTCKSCESTVHDALISIEGVNYATISHESSTAIVNSNGTNRDILSNAIRHSGFTVDELGLDFNWNDGSVWKQSAHNTKWCLIGCSIGDFGTIAFFQFTGIGWPVLSIMILAIINGLITSILLETVILMRELSFVKALNTAIGMSLISMISMEVAMNSVDVFLTGGAKLNWWVIPFMLLAGYVTPLPYNYWRLKVLGKSCCG